MAVFQEETIYVFEKQKIAVTRYICIEIFMHYIFTFESYFGTDFEEDMQEQLMSPF